MRRFLRDNGLSVAFGLLFLAALAGQAVAGLADFNNRQVLEGGQTVSLGSFLASSDFAVDVSENWQSEYLQFFLYILATVWLVQRGSPESKPPGRIGLESDEDQRVGRYATERSPKWARTGGWRTAVFSRSLCIAMGSLFLFSWLAQSIAGLSTFNEEQLAQLTDPVSWPQYVAGADFWNRTLQNWQSEFLAIGSMAVLSVYLRQRGSPESKPVGAPHDVTEKSG
ncbi:DUF6766 family protein [Actinophytocola sp.]|uniref:DUF6766 family protein n=1 Tax=Actinophytocola sp. TaxID=1872138 RepID=UPI002EDAA248